MTTGRDPALEQNPDPFAFHVRLSRGYPPSAFPVFQRERLGAAEFLRRDVQ